MHKKIGLSLIALCMASAVFAQTDNKQEQNVVTVDESAFTFSESQLGEDDNVAQEVTFLDRTTTPMPVKSATSGVLPDSNIVVSTPSTLTFTSMATPPTISNVASSAIRLWAV